MNIPILSILLLSTYVVSIYYYVDIDVTQILFPMSVQANIGSNSEILIQLYLLEME